jgi:selenium metabolism protein YedF
MNVRNEDVAKTVLFVGSEAIGQGDEGLGRLLMGKFLDTMAQFTDDLTHVILVNAGAKLPVTGSPVLEQLQHLEQMGARVLTCGTCLDHFGVRGDLVVGSVSNMIEIVGTLTKASKIIHA